MILNKFKFPCENKNKIPPFMDTNQDVVDAILMYGKKNMVYSNFLEVMFYYFQDNVITNLLKLMSSPNITKHEDIASLLGY